VLYTTNDAGESVPRDPAEERQHQQQEAIEGNTAGTPSPIPVSTKLDRVAELARTIRGQGLTSLSHHIDVTFLEAAVSRTRRDGATGIDGVTAEEYEVDLKANLESLLERFKTGSYFAPPVRRTEIPKGDGTQTRPIGIPTYEDKTLQRAMLMVLEAVYEQEFHDFSYGFRPNRSAHQALARLRGHVMEMWGGWILEVDIKSFFDTLDHAVLRSFLDQRVRDGVLRRAIDKWLKAGVMKDGLVLPTDQGTPQGGVISPLLANVYLHYVLDEWFMRDVQPRMRGRTHLVRYADDFVFVFEHEDDARRVLAVLAKRFAKYGLQLHPEKTRLLPFHQPPRGGWVRREARSARDTFDFLGFTLLWKRTARGGYAVFTIIARSRWRRALRRIHEWLRIHCHMPIDEQYEVLSQKLRGLYAYFGKPGNARPLSDLVHQVERSWRRWLSRRSQRGAMTWERFKSLLALCPLPRFRVPAAYRRAASP
jgi:RNA-directed DNA polymerase